MSLKVLAAEARARICGSGTGDETLAEQPKQQLACFIDAASCFTSMEQDQPQKSAKYDPCFTVSFSRDETDETRIQLSLDLLLGLKRLCVMPTPLVRNKSVWPEIVADALRIAHEGSATQALDLGWDALHLFGWEPSAEPDTWASSLAVVMEGWPVVDVSADYITLRKGNVSRPFKNRPRPALTRYLWDL